jgi:mannose-6-phosphate isomerase
VLLCTEGRAELTTSEGTLTLEKGCAVFAAAGTEVTASGPAVLYRATTNLALFSPGG